MNKKLYRDEYHKVLGGVCSGLAEYFDMDVTIVRLLFAFTFFVMGVGFIPYIILWIVLPKKGYLYSNFNNPTVDYRVPPQQSADDAGTPPPLVNPFAGNPYSANPFGPPPFTPSQPMPPRPKSHAGIIIGVVLIIVGALVLVNNYDLIPDFDFDRLWPVVLVVVGASLIVSGQTKAWQKRDWQHKDKSENSSIDNPSSTENATVVEPE